MTTELEGPEAQRRVDRIAEERAELLTQARTPEYREKLRRGVDLLLQPHEFSPGQLVQWKPGLRNKRRPAYGEAAVVASILALPAHDTDDASSPYFKEPLDIVLGMLDADGDLVLYHFDSRRFEPFAE